MRFTVYAVIFAAAVFSTGCSTITQSDSQSLSLTATYEGKPVSPVCELSNDKGHWDSKAPANVSVRKSGEDLVVTCKEEGMPDGLLKAISRAAGSMWGNIIFGGGIGAVIDHEKGTGYDYPNQLSVKMGESVVIDKKDEKKAAHQAAQPSSQPESKPATQQETQQTAQQTALHN